MRFIAVVLGLLLLVSADIANAQDHIRGKWLTESGNAQVEIKQCGDKLCGEIVWLREPKNDKGEDKTDLQNPDPALKQRKLIGLAMLSGFVKSSSPGKWEDGEIYNPEDGKTYKCTLTLEGADILKVRGYVGVPLFGKTQTWKRA